MKQAREFTVHSAGQSVERDVVSPIALYRCSKSLASRFFGDVVVPSVTQAGRLESLVQ
jgi:hypothetical protein